MLLLFGYFVDNVVATFFIRREFFFHDIREKEKPQNGEHNEKLD
jgi:hypothetical protein